MHRNQLKRDGDTPTGSFSLAGWESKNDYDKYGYTDVLRLGIGYEGNASKTLGTRWWFLIHGSDTNPNGSLRGTRGCIRADN